MTALYSLDHSRPYDNIMKCQFGQLTIALFNYFYVNSHCCSTVRLKITKF